MTRREAERQTHQADTLRALGFTREESDQLRRISMTLQRWFERECGDSRDNSSWCLIRGRKLPDGAFEHDDDGQPYVEHQYYPQGQPTVYRYTRIPDRETGARRRLTAILYSRNTCPKCGAPPDKTDETCPRCDTRPGDALSAYIQTDPRGAALYILRPGDVPEGQDIGSSYTRGICVY